MGVWLWLDMAESPWENYTQRLPQEMYQERSLVAGTGMGTRAWVSGLLSRQKYDALVQLSGSKKVFLLTLLTL